MADKQIADLTDGGAVAAGDLGHVVRSGNSRRGTFGNAAGKSTGSGSGDVAAGNHDHSGVYQPLASSLTSWAAITRASGFDTWVATPNSANLRSLLTDETGTALLYFQGGALGTPSGGTLSSCDNASTTAKGVAEFATAAEFRVGTDTARALVVSEVWTAAAGATLALVSTTYTADFSLFASLAAPSAAMGGNRTLGAPSNTKNGQFFVFRFTATGSTRTLTLNGAYNLWAGVEVGPYSVTTSQTLYVCGFIDDAGVAQVTSIGRR